MRKSILPLQMKMGNSILRKVIAAVALVSFGGLALSSDAADFETQRREMLDRIGPFIYNTDGCDMYYYPCNKPVTPEAFKALRLDFARRTNVRTVSYCPVSSGFGFFTVPGVGEFNDRMQAQGEDVHQVYPKDAKDIRHFNAAPTFARKFGTDAIQMALDWCRENGRQMFISIRFNDTHDSHPSYGHFLFPPFKKAHPECLMGTKERPPKCCRWTAVNFAAPLVRERMRTFVRQFFEKYDMDGLEIDMFRHVQLFKSVADGGVASEAERELMTELMADIRRIAEECGRKRGRPILLSIRTPDSVGYCRAVGIDLERWFERKLVDIWTATGYFQLEQWPTTVAFARRHGVRCYASIDESRIPGAARAGKRPIIYGREALSCYRARYAAAMAAGCDGVSLFNLEYRRLTNFAQDDLHDLAGLSKRYFATERGAGGYAPETWLTDGGRFDRMPRIDPGFARTLEPGRPYAFELMIAEDVAAAAAKGRTPTVRVLALSGKGESVAVTLNGHELPAAGTEEGASAFAVDPGWLRNGLNAFSVVAAARSTLHDFAVKVDYR